MYGPHSLNEDGSIIPFEEQLAIVSHYLHNRGNKSADTYEEKAEGLIEDIYNIHQKENDCVAEAGVFVFRTISACLQAEIHFY